MTDEALREAVALAIRANVYGGTPEASDLDVADLRTADAAIAAVRAYDAAHEGEWP